MPKVGVERKNYANEPALKTQPCGYSTA